MSAATSNCYRRNLIALTDAQPDVAVLVDATPIPQGISPAKGRDDCDTFLLPSGSGRSVWFGDSSMPTISAHETFGGLRGDGRNMILPGILTGKEVIIILERIPSHSALFVLEKELFRLKLALTLHDYVGFIEAGRLVFAVGDATEVVNGFTGFFERNPGYELPVHLLPTPQLSPAQVAEWQVEVEVAGRAVATIHAREVELVTRRLNARRTYPLSGSPHLALLCTDPAPMVMEHARRIERAATRLGWPTSICIPDSPRTCHVSARLAAIESVDAELVVLVNDDGGLMRSLLPAELPIITWLATGGRVAKPERMAELLTTFECDHVVTHAHEQYEGLMSASAPFERVTLAEPAADDVAYFPEATDEKRDDSRSLAVAILDDLPDDRASSCEIGQASHIALWNAVQDEAAKQIAVNGDADPQDLLALAGQTSGTKLRDSKVRDHFAELIRSRVLPATVARVALDCVRRGGHRVELYGRHWPDTEGVAELRRGEIPVGPALNRVFNRNDIVLVPCSTPTSTQLGLDALVAGTQVIFFLASVLRARRYPGFSVFGLCARFYQTSDELDKILSGCVDARLSSPRTVNGDPRFRIESSRSWIVNHHCVARTLELIVASVRRQIAAVSRDAGVSA